MRQRPDEVDSDVECVVLLETTTTSTRAQVSIRPQEPELATGAAESTEPFAMLFTTESAGESSEGLLLGAGAGRDDDGKAEGAQTQQSVEVVEAARSPVDIPRSVSPTPSPPHALSLSILPALAQHRVLCSLSANDLWSLCSTSTATRDSVQHAFHSWIKDAPLFHGVPTPGKPTKSPQEANLPLAFLAYVLGLGNPSPGSEQWRSFRKLYRRYGSQVGIPSPLSLADVTDARRGPLGWDPRDWNSPVYDHLMNEPPKYLVARPLGLRVREALGQLVWSMVYWMCDGGGDVYYLRRWPPRLVRNPNEAEKQMVPSPTLLAFQRDADVLDRLIAQGHFVGTAVAPPPLSPDDESLVPDDPDEKPSPHAEESPILRFLRIRRYLDRCWTHIWRFSGPLPVEILRSLHEDLSDESATARPYKRARTDDGALALDPDVLDSFPTPASICSKNLYPRMLLNIIKRGDHRTLSLLLAVFGRPEKEWRSDLRRANQEAAAAAQAAAQAAQNNNGNGAGQALAFAIVAAAAATTANNNDSSSAKDSCLDGGIRFHTPPNHPPGTPPQWIVWFTQKGSGGPHMMQEGDWDRGHVVYRKIERVMRYYGGVLGRAPVPEVPVFPGFGVMD